MLEGSLNNPPKPRTKDSTIGRGSPLATEERRRSQRVMIRVAVTLHLELGGRPVKLEAFTVAVNIHGAMVCAPQNLPMDSKVEIENKVTLGRKTARVVRQPQSSPEGYLIPVEFETPSYDFWHISFPPSDWNPADS